MKIKEAIIVEGRYDKMRVSQCVDTVIIATEGFGIFKNKSKKEYIKKLSNERGIIILTDSDGAGAVIRNHLKSFVEPSLIKNAYVPKIEGKEKRKSAYSKEGILGVEAASSADIIEALKKAGAGNIAEVKTIYTSTDLYNHGISGKENSAKAKAEFIKLMGLPDIKLSTKDLLKYMNLNPDITKNALENLHEHDSN